MKKSSSGTIFYLQILKTTDANFAKKGKWKNSESVKQKKMIKKIRFLKSEKIENKI